MSSFTAHILRLETQTQQRNTAARLLTTAKDTLEYFIQAVPLQWQTRFKESGGASHDLTGYASVTLTISEGPATRGAPLMVKTVSSYGACTQEQWDAGTHQQVTFSFTEQETNISTRAQESRPVFWRITAVTTAGAVPVELGRGWVVLQDNGGTGTPAATPELYVTQAQLAAALSGLGGVAAMTLQDGFVRTTIGETDVKWSYNLASDPES